MWMFITALIVTGVVTDGVTKEIRRGGIIVWCHHHKKVFKASIYIPFFEGLVYITNYNFSHMHTLHLK